MKIGIKYQSYCCTFNKPKVFGVKHSSFAANLEHLILGCTMTTLEPKSISLLSQLIVTEPDRNGQILSEKYQTLVQKSNIYQRKKWEQGNLCK